MRLSAAQIAVQVARWYRNSSTPVWETGEFLTLSENGEDIANGATSIELYVTYRGIQLAGDDYVTVN